MWLASGDYRNLVSNYTLASNEHKIPKILTGQKKCHGETEIYRNKFRNLNLSLVIRQTEPESAKTRHQKLNLSENSLTNSNNLLYTQSLDSPYGGASHISPASQLVSDDYENNTLSMFLKKLYGHVYPFNWYHYVTHVKDWSEIFLSNLPLDDID